MIWIACCLEILLLLGGFSPQAWVEQANLTASNKKAVDYFGYSVSLTDNFALIGARYVDPEEITDAGAAYMFVRSGPVWNQQQILTASDKAPDSYFGSSVSLTDDYALIGASFGDPDAIADAGVAYIFVRSGIVWTQQAILKASNKAASDSFGDSVSLTNSYALVGVPRSDPDYIIDAGAAYIFARSGTSWIEQAILTSNNKSSSDYFGDSTALSESHALVGARWCDVDSVLSAGAAYVFTRQGTRWKLQVRLTASNKSIFDSFGSFVSISDDYALIGVGAPSQSYIFSRTEDGWMEQQILNYSAGGCVVSITNNYAMLENNIFSRSGSIWGLHTTIRNSATTSLALTDNFAIIGNPATSVGGLIEAGRAIIFQNDGEHGLVFVRG